MPEPCPFETLDDLMRNAVQDVLQNGAAVVSSRGSNVEVQARSFLLRNPAQRLSRTATRGKLFSAIGELLWYLRGGNTLADIEYYIPAYREDADDGLIMGAYGPRLFGRSPKNHFQRTVALLKRKPNTRQAVIPIFESADLDSGYKDTPCTCLMQYLLRQNRLDCIVYMRSNDAYLGLPHDVFCFTMIQEILARSLEVQLGTYTHMAGSLHLYDRNRAKAEQFLNEGWQSTTSAMSPMPVENLAGSIHHLLDIEERIRLHGVMPNELFHSLNAYWQDFATALWAWRVIKDGRPQELSRLRDALHSPVFALYFNERIGSSEYDRDSQARLDNGRD